jgi:hypothetical protein
MVNEAPRAPRGTLQPVRSSSSSPCARAAAAAARARARARASAARPGTIATRRGRGSLPRTNIEDFFIMYACMARGGTSIVCDDHQRPIEVRVLNLVRTVRLLHLITGRGVYL